MVGLVGGSDGGGDGRDAVADGRWRKDGGYGGDGVRWCGGAMVEGERDAVAGSVGRGAATVRLGCGGVGDLMGVVVLTGAAALAMEMKGAAVDGCGWRRCGWSGGGSVVMVDGGAVQVVMGLSDGVVVVEMHGGDWIGGGGGATGLRVQWATGGGEGWGSAGCLKRLCSGDGSAGDGWS
ncbi:hypothetical protein F0562_013387 [Nyssa sinensis]|uniref:Uncharacterized protein n=1 Tax=Nyssa sinensis TaxID=561372 RepID=A0A5J4ZMG9_9ASTE|nr:hypothetical protein F0562_013387 [Nyssa sinensis]